jgi:hypothetical protein
MILDVDADGMRRDGGGQGQDSGSAAGAAVTSFLVDRPVRFLCAGTS